MRKPLYGSLFLSAWLALMVSPPARGDYLLVKDVLSTSGGHLESTNYLLDYSTGQTAVGRSEGTSHIESGGFWAWEPWGVEVAVEEAVAGQVPEAYTLSQNYPNPFNPETRIRYHLPEDADVALSVYNVLGQQVRQLVDREQSAGEHVVTWNGQDDIGRPVASGIYFYRLVTGEFCEVRKMLLLK